MRSEVRAHQGFGASGWREGGRKGGQGNEGRRFGSDDFRLENPPRPAKKKRLAFGGTESQTKPTTDRAAELRTKSPTASNNFMTEDQNLQRSAPSGPRREKLHWLLKLSNYMLPQRRFCSTCQRPTMRASGRARLSSERAPNWRHET